MLCHFINVNKASEGTGLRHSFVLLPDTFIDLVLRLEALLEVLQNFELYFY